jgi:ankyrin repeat protein
MLALSSKSLALGFSLVLSTLTLFSISSSPPLQAKLQDTITFKTVKSPVGQEAKNFLCDTLIKEAEFGTPQTLQPLLDKGADPGASGTMDNHSAMTSALASNNMANAYALLPYLKQDTFNTAQRAIFYAARRGDLNLLNRLMSFTGHRAEHLLPSHSEATTCEIYQAIEYGHLPIAKRLIDLRPECSNTVDIAIKNGQLSLLDWLIRRNPSLKQRIAREPQYMQQAVASGKIDMVKRLKHYGAKRDYLEIAIEKGYLPLVKYFHNQGDSFIRSPTTLVQLAARNGKNDIVAYLLKQGIPPLPDLDQRTESTCPTLANIAAETNNAPLLKALLGEKKDDSSEWDDPCSGDTLLHSAAKGQSPLALKLSITHINTQNKWGETPLQLAVKNADITLTEYLLKHNARQDITDNNGNTPLHIALSDSSLSNNNAIFLLLINDQPNLNIQNKQGLTPLMQSITNGDLFYTNLLLQAGADAALPDNTGQQVLHYVLNTEPNTLYSLEHFISNGANLKAADYQGTTLLHLAAKYEPKSSHAPTPLEQLIAAKVDLNATDDNKDTPLIIAINHRQTRNALLLIKAGADINQANKLGNTPLHYATQNGLTLVIDTLISQGANINALNNEGTPPVFMAKDINTINQLKSAGSNFTGSNYQGASLISYLSGRTDRAATLPIIKNALEAGASPDEKDNLGQTTLHRAIRFNVPEISTLLLQYKADPNLTDSTGATPLHLAVRTRSIIQTNLLIQAKANLNLPNSYGKTPLHQSIEVVEPKIANLLIQAGATINTRDYDQRTPLQSAIASGQILLASKLIELGADINNRSKGDWTALHYAAQWGDESLVKLLLDKGAINGLKTWGNQLPADLVSSKNPQLKQLLQSTPNQYVLLTHNDQWGNTPLHQAVQDNNVALIKKLLSQQADPNAKNNYGDTALHTALYVAPHYPNTITEVLKLLIQAKADPTLLDSSGRNSLEIALNYPINFSAIKILTDGYLNKLLENPNTQKRIADLLPKQEITTIQWLIPTLMTNPSIKPSDIWTWAISHQDSKILVPWLLSQNLSAKVEIKGFINPLSLALYNEYYDLTAEFLKAGNTYQSTPDDQELLDKLISHHKLKAAEFLIAQPTYHLNLANNDSAANQLLSAAALEGKRGLVLSESLLKSGAHHSLSNNIDGAVINALKVDSVELLVLYKSYGFDYTNAPELVINAASYNAVESLKYLKSQGLDLNYHHADGTGIITTVINNYALEVLNYLATQSLTISSTDHESIFEAFNNPSSYALSSDIDETTFIKTLAQHYPQLILNPTVIQTLISSRRSIIANTLLISFKPKWKISQYQETIKQLIIENLLEEKDWALFDTLSASLPQLTLIEPPSNVGEQPTYLLNGVVDNVGFLQHLLSKGYQFSQDELEHLLARIIQKTHGKAEPLLASLQLLANQPNFKLGTNTFSGLAHVHDNNDDLWLKEKYNYLLSLFNKERIPSDALINVLGNNYLCTHYTDLVKKHIQNTDHSKPWISQWVASKMTTAPSNTAPNYQLECLTQPNIRQALIAIPELKSELAKNGLAITHNSIHSLELLQSTIKDFASIGADINYVDTEGNNLAYHWTHSLIFPMKLADETILAPSLTEYLQGLEWLKKQGVHLEATNKVNYNLLHHLLGSESTNPELTANIIMLLQKVLIIEPNLAKTVDHANDQPIHLAIKNNSFTTEQRLLASQILEKYGSDLNSITVEGNTALMLAIQNENNDLIAWLINQKVNTQTINEQGQNTLHIFTQQKRYDWVTQLVNNGNSTDTTDKQGDTILHYIARQVCEGNCSEQRQLVELLINKNRAIINNQNNDNETAITIATYHNNLPIIQLLVNAKADINKVNNINLNAFQIALNSNNPKILHYLINAGSDITKTDFMGNHLAGYLNKHPTIALKQVIKSKHPDFKFSVNIESLAPDAFYWYSILNDSDQIAIDVAKQLDITPFIDYRHSTHDNNGLIHVAAKANRVDILKKILSAKGHPAIDLPNSKRETPLQLAIKANALESIEFLLEQGANPNYLNQNGDNAILIAVDTNQTDTIKIILDTTKQNNITLDFNKQDSHYNTALHKAVLNQNATITALLINAGANTEIYNNDSLTPLLLAVEKPNLAIVNALLKADADLTAIDNEDRNVLLHALEYFIDQDELFTQAQYKKTQDLIDQLLAAGADINSQSGKGNNALYISLAKYPIAKHLLTKSPNLKALNYEDETVLFQAARANYTEFETKEIFDALIKQGVDINSRNIYGETALQAAIRHSKPNALFYLLTLGADPNVVKDSELDQTGYDLPMYILGSNYIESKKKLPAMEYLIKAGARLNHTNANGENIIFISLRDYDNGLVFTNWLLQQGAKPTVTNLKGQTPLHILIQETGEYKLTNPQYFKKIQALVKQFIDQGVDINARDMNGKTALHYATNESSNLWLDILLPYELDLNIQDSTDHSVLDHILTNAEIFDTEKLIPVLLNKHANPNLRNGYGKTSLHSAVDRENISAVQHLLKAGANPNLRDWTGQTSLHSAYEHHNDELVDLLLKAGAKPDLANKLGILPKDGIPSAPNN